MNKEQAKGKVDEVLGSIKRKTGQWSGSVPLEVKGIVQELKGELTVAVGNTKECIDKDHNKVKAT